MNRHGARDRQARREHDAGLQLVIAEPQCRILTRNDVGSLEYLSWRLLGFAGRYHQAAGRFRWNVTARDLPGLMDRITCHEQHDDPAGEPLPRAA